MARKDKTTDQNGDLIETALMLDETCNHILRALLEDRPLRFSEIQSYIAKMFGVELTNRDLSRHLKHMQVRNLIKRTEPEFQTVEYSLSDEFRALYFVPKEDLLEYLDIGRDKELLPPELRTIKFDEKEHYRNLSKEDIDKETDKDLHDVLSLSLWELKLSIENNLQLKEGESDEAFWTFFANPLYRLHEKEASEKCRYNTEYLEVLFQKIDLLIEQLRDDRYLLRQRRARANNRTEK